MTEPSPPSPPTSPCPSCRAPMASLRLDGHYGTTVDLDLCHRCHGLWFDERESLRLTPGATLRVFETIHDRRDAVRQPLADRLTCPRCDLRLLETHDRQRDTAFRYWRCGRRHGRFITFFDFLREKEFIRPLTQAQLADLRAQVRSVNCSNCGAPVDLQTSTACAYCRAALSMLDFAQVERLLADLSRAEARRVESARRAQVDPSLQLALLRERLQVESFFSRVENKPDWTSWSRTDGLVEAGIGAVVGLIRKLT